MAQLQEGQSRLETKMDNLEAGQEELKGRMDSMAGRMGDIIGSGYEARSLRVAPRRLQRLGIRNATLMRNKRLFRTLAARQTPLRDILPVLDQAITDGRISQAEAEDLENLDLAFTGWDPSRPP